MEDFDPLKEPWAAETFAQLRNERDRREGVTSTRAPLRQVHPPVNSAPAGCDDYDRLPESAYNDAFRDGGEPARGEAGAARGEGKAFEFVAVGDLELTEPEYHVDGMIETETIGVVFGDPGCGKSFLAVDLACSVASGSDFHGRKVRQGSVFYIAGEGHNGLARRFHAWGRHHGQDMSRLPVFKSNRAAQLLDGASAAEVGRAVAGLSALHGAPALIIIDTLARNFGGGDENSTQDMNGFVAAIDDLRACWLKTTIIIVHHTGHSDKGRGRGSTVLKGALDFEFRVEKDGEEITVSNPKMKDAPELPEQFFTLTDVQLTPRINSAVLVSAEAPKKRGPKITGQAKIALQAFGDALAHHGITKTGDLFPTDRQCVSLDHWRTFCDGASLSSGESESASRKAFHSAKSKLQEAGVICIAEGFAWRASE
ncbi:AAA domain-containing protein [Rhodobacter sp. JA431]|uniref:helicase RepA family protein n=1 Tax=Rhodobacter sp. JA431 TaxID=570013 RepID=UPI000BC9EEC1|nr:helicase RepA family protein [Rhodobacter sp. JA431]SOC11189.1 AAA domain-containing protein [Rhodobacter sp. JA431]